MSKAEVTDQVWKPKYRRSGAGRCCWRGGHRRTVTLSYTAGRHQFHAHFYHHSSGKPHMQSMHATIMACHLVQGLFSLHVEVLLPATMANKNQTQPAAWKVCQPASNKSLTPVAPRKPHKQGPKAIALKSNSIWRSTTFRHGGSALPF